MAATRSVLVKISSGGLTGWGESTPLAAPCYGPEFAGGVFTVVRDWLAPALIGQRVTSGRELQRKLAIFKGNYFAKAALDTAWWDLYAQSLNQPLYRVLGGETIRCFGRRRFRDSRFGGGTAGEGGRNRAARRASTQVEVRARLGCAGDRSRAQRFSGTRSSYRLQQRLPAGGSPHVPTAGLLRFAHVRTAARV